MTGTHPKRARLPLSGPVAKGKRRTGGVPDSAVVIELIEAFRRSKAMFTAVSFALFDRLENSSADVETLAAELHAQPEPFERLLDTCVSLGLLRKLRSGRYTNEPVSSAYLCRSSEQTLAGYVLYSNDVLFRLWTHLEDAIREGTPRWHQAFGTSGGIFDGFYKTQEAMRTFLQGMHGFGLLSSASAVAAFNLTPFQKMVDLGGATGHLVTAACQRYPRLRAAIFDLPRVIDLVRPRIAQLPVAPRIELIAGDFFRDDLPEADIFAMCQILHDWPEEKIRMLLDKIYQRLPSEGGVLIVEKLLAPGKTAPVSTLMQSLNMLVCTEGRERTLQEYRALLETAGFRRVEGCVTGAPFDAVIGFKRERRPSRAIKARGRRAD
jgi:acetylserotonin N-methyltransferase